MLVDMRECYRETDYFPFLVELERQDGVYEVLYQTVKPFRETNIAKYTKPGVKILFDMGAPNRAEAAVNLSIMGFTIFLMVCFSLTISSKVASIALNPLEGILSKVRDIGHTIYRKVEFMQTQMADWGGMSDTSSTGEKKEKGEPEDISFETALLEKVVKKIAVLSEITMRQAKPSDIETLQYLGEVDNQAERIRATQLEAEKQGLHRNRGAMDSFHPGECLEDEDTAKSVLSWSFNALALSPSQNRAVCAGLLNMVSVKVVDVQQSTINNFVSIAAASYLEGPQYHNWYHAVDVTHAVLLVLNSCSQQNVFLSWLEEFALVSSAVCHDIGHPGVNNDFLVQTSHELAIRYNDTSPLENMHCACLFEIVNNPRAAIFATLSRERYKEVRAMCVEAILHTDNVHHMPMVRQLQMFGEVNSEMLEQARDLYHVRAASVAEDPDNQKENVAGWPPRELTEQMWEPESRRMLRNVLLHLADINNTVKPFDLSKEWAWRVLEEFFAQGDLEKQNDLPLMPLNDRAKTNRPFSQISFIEFFAAPFIFASVRILAPLEALVEELLTNASVWMQEWITDANPPEEEIRHVLTRLKRLEEKAPLRISPSKLRQRALGSVSSRNSRTSGMLPRASSRGKLSMTPPKFPSEGDFTDSQRIRRMRPSVSQSSHESPRQLSPAPSSASLKLPVASGP